jgi:hypothetical protein
VGSVAQCTPAPATSVEEVLLSTLPVALELSVRVLLDILVDEAAKSALSDTILTPYALKPLGNWKVIILVEVIPSFDESVIGDKFTEGAIQVQSDVGQTVESLEGSAQDCDTSPRTGQHVTVVIVGTPLVA